MANELNSVFSVGRITDNTISVRVGAIKHPDSEYALIPRTHYITVLLFADDNWLKDIEYTNRVTVTSKWFVRESKTGKLINDSKLNSNQQSKLIQRVLTIIKNNTEYEKVRKKLDDNLKSKTYEEIKKEKSKRNFIEEKKIHELVNNIYANDQVKFNCNLENIILGTDIICDCKKDLGEEQCENKNKNKNKNDKDKCKEKIFEKEKKCKIVSELKEERFGYKRTRVLPYGVYHRDIWLKIVSTLENVGGDASNFELPYNKLELPVNNQALIWTDKLKTESLLLLRDGKFLDGSDINADLTVPLKSGKSIVLLPNSVETKNNGTNLLLKFPSLASYGLKKSDLKGDKLNNGVLTVKHDDQAAVYNNIHYSEVPEEKIKLAKVNITSKKIQSKDGFIDLHFQFVMKDKKQIADKLLMSVDGVDIASAKEITKSGSKPILKDLVIDPGAIVEIDKNKSVRFKLNNLIPNTKVKFNFKTQKSDKNEGEPFSIEIPVI